MTARADFDVGPLSWVKGEIDHAIQRAQEALRAFAADGAETSQLKASQSHLHQAHGALSIVGLEGITRVSEELEGLLAGIEKEASLRKTEIFGLVERALGGIRTYLDQLMAGNSNQPLRLYPLYRDVVAARGGRADPTDLYFPDLSFRPPKRDKIPIPLKAADADKSLREQRGRYQRGLLKWLKNDASGAEDMRAAIETIEAAQGPSAQRAFWWVSLAFFDALTHKALPQDPGTKQLCNRIEQQIKRLVEGTPSVAERLMREVLYYVARAKPASGRVREVQEAYHLGQTIPAAENDGGTVEELPALKSAREHLAHAKDAWNKFASGNPPSLLAFRDSVAALKDDAEHLGNSDLTALAGEVAGVAAWLTANRESMSEAVALEVATALLLLENALAGLTNLSGEFAQQAELLRSRLKDCMLGKLRRTAPEIPMLDEMSRKAQERLLMSQVVSEMQANLRTIEQVLDTFFRDSSKRDELSSLDKPVHQLLGALEMLGEQRARDSLAAAAAEIRTFSGAAHHASPQDFEHIAQTLSGLGFYIEGLAHGKADFEAAMRPIAAAREGEADAAQPVATVEAQVAEQQRETANLYEEWKIKPDDGNLRAELKKNLAALQKDAGLIADQKLEASAGNALKALDKTSTMPLTPFLKEAIEKITSAAAPSPSPEAAKLIDASAEAVDAELLGVYLEESDEVLATIREHLDTVREQHANKEALTTIRRGFHTLKGSGRMVGLMRLGEAAWAVEQAMNSWVQEERAATPELLQLIELAHEYFADNVKRLKAGGASSNEHALVAAAERVRRGETQAARAPAAVKALKGPAAQPLAPERTDATPAPADSVPASDAPMEREELVQIGGYGVSKTLFAIFSGEARAHVSAIREEHETLRQHGVVSDALLRAVHTLAGTSGTVKVSSLSDLGYALEKALQKLATSELSEEEQSLVGDAIDTLETMVASVVELRVPPAVPELVARLEHIGEQGGVPRESAPEEQADLTRASSAPAREAKPAGAAELDVNEPEPAESPLEDLDLDITLERRQRRLDDDLDPELLQIFLDEAHELVPAVGAAMRDWRDNPGNPALGQALQRVLHTLKGSSRMAGAMAMGELTHHMETRVENAMSVKTLPTSLFEELETSWDRMGFLFEELQKPRALQENLAAAVAAPRGPQPAAIEEPEAAPEPAPSAVVAPAPVAKTLPLAERELQPKALLRVRADVVDRLVNQAGEVAIARSRIEGEMRALKAAMQELTDNVARLRAQLREIEIQSESQMQSRLELAKESMREFDPLEFDRFTRFQEVTRLMAESVSDVSTVHGNLVNAVDETEKALLAQARLNRDLQQDLMRVRMVPFGSLQERLYRVVRQSAKEVGKRANLDIKGTQVELDRSVLERITGPFEHLLRNAVTHGIESPDKRRAASKPEIGEIRLELKQEGNEVQLSLSDDGAGLDIERIREKAIEKGLMRADTTLTEAEIADFIFHAGFSTAAVVSQLAGRGVGMDVVRSEVAALGGRVEMRFTRGQGTRFVIYLPLTLAVTQTVLVRAGNKSYAIPSVMVEQVLQLRQEQLVAAYASRQTEWQDRRYPFHYLPHLLGLSEVVAEQKRFSPTLYLRSGTNAIALHVDEMVGSNLEIVVKAIGPQLQRVAGITGATVLGTGEIVLILNPVQLALKELAARPAIVHEAPKPQVAATQPTIMVVDDSLTVRKVTGRLLERHGYIVVTARDGVEAMEKLLELVPDVMLVDIEMPRMDGFDLTRNVRADKRLARVPIIMISSRTADKHQNYAKEIGVSHFLGKPYQEDDLIEKISGFLKERRAAA
jgi:chemosensory pili system protein ChpA (sensor histidine kinase/response regulator)